MSIESCHCKTYPVEIYVASRIGTYMKPMFKVYTFMLDDAFLVVYDTHSYSTRDGFIQKMATDNDFIM